MRRIDFSTFKKLQCKKLNELEILRQEKSESSWTVHLMKSGRFDYMGPVKSVRQTAVLDPRQLLIQMR